MKPRRKAAGLVLDTFEQAFKNIDDALRKDSGCTSELDYTEQTSWMLFLRYLDDLEKDRYTEAELSGRQYAYILERLFGHLPDLFADEDELRRLWGAPETRQQLLDALSDEGFNEEALDEMQRLIGAEDSDIYDVLSYVRFATPAVSREMRARSARQVVKSELDARLQEFIDFVLQQYVAEGVSELASEKLAPLLQLRYGAVPEALATLGADAATVRAAFVDFQRFLYDPVPAA